MPSPHLPTYKPLSLGTDASLLALVPPPDMLKPVNYVAHIFVTKRTVGIRLKCLHCFKDKIKGGAIITNKTQTRA